MYASASAVRSAAPAPRGQNSSPTTRLTAQPIAMSSTRSSPTRQPAGWMMLKRITSVSVNAACPAANEIAAGATPASRTASGSRNHSSVVSVPISAQHAAPTTKPTTVPSDAAHDALAGVQRVRSQHRQRAEDHPERVLHAAQLATSTASASADGAAHAVVQPHRVAVEVRRRALLCGARACPRRPRAGARAAAPASCGARRRRSARCSRAICETAKPSSCARKLGSSEVMNSRRPAAPSPSRRRAARPSGRPEARAVARALHRCPALARSSPTAARSSLAGSPPAPRAARRRARAPPRRPTFTAHAASAERRAVRRARLLWAMIASASSARRPGARSSAPACSGWSAGRASRGTRGAAPRPPSSACGDRRSIVAAARAPIAPGRARRRPRRGAARRAPVQAATAGARSGSRVGAGHSTATPTSDAADAIPQPARRSGIDEAGPASVTGRMKASSSEVDALGEHRADDAGEQHAEADERHRRGASHALREARVPTQTNTRPASASAACACSALAHRPAEVDQQQHGERAERRERRHVRVPDHLVADREQRRHDDRRPPRPAQRREPAIARREPSYEEPHLRSADLRTPGSASPAQAVDSMNASNPPYSNWHSGNSCR